MALDVRADRNAETRRRSDRQLRADEVTELGLEHADHVAEAALLHRVHALGLAGDVAGAAAACDRDQDMRSLGTDRNARRDAAAAAATATATTDAAIDRILVVTPSRQPRRR
jgi:hypothetical protein